MALEEDLTKETTSISEVITDTTTTDERQRKVESLLSILKNDFAVASYDDAYNDLVKQSQEEMDTSSPFERKLIQVISYMFSEDNHALSYGPSSLISYFFQIYKARVLHDMKVSKTVNNVLDLYGLIKEDHEVYNKPFDVILHRVITKYILQQELCFPMEDNKKETATNLLNLMKVLHRRCFDSQNYFERGIYKVIYQVNLKFDCSVVLNESSKVIKSLRRDLKETVILKSLFFIIYTRVMLYYPPEYNKPGNDVDIPKNLRQASLMLYILVKYVFNRTNNIHFIHSTDLKRINDTVTDIYEEICINLLGMTIETLDDVEKTKEIIEKRIKTDNKDIKNSRVYRHIQCVCLVISQINPEFVNKLRDMMLDPNFSDQDISGYHNFSLFAKVVDSFTDMKMMN